MTSLCTSGKSGLMFFAASMLLACQSAVTVEESRESLANHVAEQIVWLNTEERLLIENRWLYSIDRKEFSRLAQAEKQEDWIPQPSPSGDRVLWVDGNRELVVEDVERDTISVIALPSWLPNEPAGSAKPTSVVFWLSSSEIFLQQFDSQAPTLQTCGHLGVSDQRWRRLPDAACLESSFFQLTRVEKLPDDRYLLFSGGEGQQALDLVRLAPLTEPATPQKLLGELLMESPFPAQARIETGKSSDLFLVFTCILNLTPPVRCDATNETGTSVYRWSPSTNTLNPAISGSRNRLRDD